MPGGTAPAAPMGEAPTYVNTPHFPQQAGPAADSSAESSPRKDLFDMSAFPFASLFFSFEVAFYSFIGNLCGYGICCWPGLLHFSGYDWFLKAFNFGQPLFWDSIPFFCPETKQFPPLFGIGST